MNNKDRRQQLETEKADLERQLAELEHSNFDYGSGTYDDESHETEETGLKLGLEQSLKDRLREIEDELGRLS